jgi:hypothetical protein
MTYSLSTAKLGLQLSTLAYIDENTNASQQQMIDAINAGLRSAGFADWSVAWGPALDHDRSNMMYATANDAGDQFAVSVRGTDWSFWLDWVEDFDNFLPLTPYSSFGVPVGPNVKIAQGTGLGLAILLAMKDGTTDLKTHITKHAQHAQILVTGHSLGGCLAAALAPCIASWLGGAANINVYTFAAPSPGNSDFADYFNNLFVTPGNTNTSTAFRFYNDIDVVPNAWATLPTIMSYYPPLLPCPSDITAVARFAARAVGHNYVQLGSSTNGSAVELRGSFISPLGGTGARAAISPVGDALFLWEAVQQHHTTTYQQLLNLTPVSAVGAKVKRILGKIAAAPAPPGAP